MSRKNPLVRQALQKPVGGSMPDRPCDRAAKNRPFMGISVKPARSCRAWVTYAGLSEVEKGKALDFPTLETDVS
jgi:hypothetical protein